MSSTWHVSLLSLRSCAATCPSTYWAYLDCRVSGPSGRTRPYWGLVCSPLSPATPLTSANREQATDSLFGNSPGAASRGSSRSMSRQFYASLCFFTTLAFGTSGRWRRKCQPFSFSWPVAQVLFSPLYQPMLTLWFVGAVLIYYALYFALTRLTNRPTILLGYGVIVFVAAVFTRCLFGIVGTQFFMYWFPFLAGVLWHRLERENRIAPEPRLDSPAHRCRGYCWRHRCCREDTPFHRGGRSHAHRPGHAPLILGGEPLHAVHDARRAVDGTAMGKAYVGELRLSGFVLRSAVVPRLPLPPAVSCDSRCDVAGAGRHGVGCAKPGNTTCGCSLNGSGCRLRRCGRAATWAVAGCQTGRAGPENRRLKRKSRMLAGQRRTHWTA